MDMETPRSWHAVSECKDTNRERTRRTIVSQYCHCAWNCFPAQPDPLLERPDSTLGKGEDATTGLSLRSTIMPSPGTQEQLWRLKQSQYIPCPSLHLAGPDPSLNQGLAMPSQWATEPKGSSVFLDSAHSRAKTDHGHPQWMLFIYPSVFSRLWLSRVPQVSPPEDSSLISCA